MGNVRRRGRVKRGICKRPEDWQRSSFRHYATGCSTQATTGLEWATKHEAVILSEAKDPGAAGRLSGSVEAFVLRRIRASGECLETFSKLLALQGSFASLRMTIPMRVKKITHSELSEGPRCGDNLQCGLKAFTRCPLEAECECLDASAKRNASSGFFASLRMTVQ